jgi:hypothetical protein
VRALRGVITRQKAAGRAIVKPLETVIADGYEEAATLRRNGYVAEADARVRMLKDIENATVDFRTFRTEDEAALRSGKSTAWFRARFPQWLAQNLARYNPLKPKAARVPLDRDPDEGERRGRARRGSSGSAGDDGESVVSSGSREEEAREAPRQPRPPRRSRSRVHHARRRARARPAPSARPHRAHALVARDQRREGRGRGLRRDVLRHALARDA